jgi:hypothetical protein
MNFIGRKKFNDLFNILTKESGISNDKFQRYEEATNLLGFFNEQLKVDKEFLSTNQLKLLKKLYNNEYKYLKKFLYPKSDVYGSIKGLSNIREIIEQKKLRKKESMHNHGISVTATLRNDLDLSKPKIFHKNNCKEISNVPYENGIIFKDRNEAIERDYRPCYVCSP